VVKGNEKGIPMKSTSVGSAAQRQTVGKARKPGTCGGTQKRKEGRDASVKFGTFVDSRGRQFDAVLEP